MSDPYPESNSGYWEERADKAETEVARLRGAIERALFHLQPTGHTTGVVRNVLRKALTAEIPMEAE